jgi:hypothetical protein
MRAEIINGILELYPQSNTEDYALGKWYIDNVDQCTRVTKGENIGFYSYKRYRRSIWNRFRLWLHNNRIWKMY